MELAELHRLAVSGSATISIATRCTSRQFTTGTSSRSCREQSIIIKAQYEPAEELSETDCSVEFRPAIEAEGDEDEYPSVVNCLPADTYLV